jgi:RNA polymerase primary sigma factor
MATLVSRQVLTSAEEAALARRAERGDGDARDELVERNLGLVWTIADRYRGRGVAFEDLLQEGAVGLVRAVERFDHRRGVRLSTYAAWWIRRALMDALANGRPIRVPPAARRQMAAIQRARAELRRMRSQSPTTDDIAERTRLSPRTVLALQAVPQVGVSLDEPIGDDPTPLGELISDPSARDASEGLERRETSRQLWSLLRRLPERQREVLVRRYGLGGDRAQSHQEIGAWLGVGEERSRQIERQALHWLRTMRGVAPLAA